jgi:putative AlgH/UPF0301 family transcriptional regulator
VLLATERTRDAAFSETVILVLQHDRSRSVGLVLNRRLGEPMATLFPDMARTGRAAEPLWAGGPVAIGINALVRGRSQPVGASVVDAEVWLVSDRARLHEALSRTERRIRVYIGLCNWGAGQLDDEIGRGLWRIQAGSAAIVFDEHPETLWRRLAGR